MVVLFDFMGSVLAVSNLLGNATMLGCLVGAWSCMDVKCGQTVSAADYGFVTKMALGRLTDSQVNGDGDRFFGDCETCVINIYDAPLTVRAV